MTTKSIVEHKEVKTNGIIFIDTETNCFRDEFKIQRCAQISWILCNLEGKRLSSYTAYIRPDGWSMSDKCSEYTGITMEKLSKEGQDFKIVYAKLLEDLSKARILCSHKVEFDKQILENEFKEHKLTSHSMSLLNSMKTKDTMKSTKGIVGLKIGGKLKWPKLGELYNFLFGSELEKAHNAESDVDAVCKCFFELQRRFPKNRNFKTD